MGTTYRIHPAIGIARVGDSPTSFYLAPERTGGLPIACDEQGNAELGEDGTERETIVFKDAEGRILRQAARFQIFVYDDKSPEGRPLKAGDEIQGKTGSGGKLKNIHWYAYLANKKASWYEFKELEGEHGYAAKHPLRNAAVNGSARQSLIVDPGPQHVDSRKSRAATFARGANPEQSQSFPPPLTPVSIESLGEMKTDDDGRLIVLGGHGASGSYLTGVADPQISHFANNDGWFDDISDGPVTAILEYHDDEDDEDQLRQVDASSWVIVGSPGYAPEIINVVTLDDVLFDLAVREFAYDTYLYGTEFSRRDVVDKSDPDLLAHWRKDSTWNPDYHPYFYRDIWPILLRAYNAQWVTDFLGISHFAHETGPGGDFEQEKVSQPPADGLDPNREMRMFVYEALRKPGQENAFTNTTAEPTDKAYGKPLMPLLCGDNPLTNTLPSKFLTLTRTQLFLLHQWAIGKFINEKSEEIPLQEQGPAGTALDRGVLGNILGGSFCPGGEVGWIVRNPAIYSEPYRINWNQAFLPDAGSTRKVGTGEFFPPALRFPGPRGRADDYFAGLEPGDLTKRSALPWQADYNECSTELVDVTYEAWNVLYADTGDPALKAKNRSSNPTLWWPAHRPMQVFRPVGDDINPTSPTHKYEQVDWARGVPPSGNPGQSRAGDLKMVTAWRELGFVVANDDPGYPLFVEIKGVAGTTNPTPPAKQQVAASASG